MLGGLIHKLLIHFGLRKAPTPTPSPPADDFVARHGLSYGEASDPISKEAHFEIERLKSLPRRRR